MKEFEELDASEREELVDEFTQKYLEGCDFEALYLIAYEKIAEDLRNDEARMKEAYDCKVEDETCHCGGCEECVYGTEKFNEMNGVKTE